MPETQKLLIDLTNNDLRYQLHFAKEILRTGYIPYSRIAAFVESYYAELDRRARTAKAERPWLFGPGIVLKTILSPTNQIYDEVNSPIVNIWEGGIDHFSATLNGPYVLKIINRRGSIVARDLLSTLQTLGHPRDVSRRTVERFLKAGLVESEDGIEIDPDESNRLQLTRSGTFYVYKLMNMIYPVQQLGWVTPLPPHRQEEIKEMRRKGGDTVKCCVWDAHSVKPFLRRFSSGVLLDQDAVFE